MDWGKEGPPATRLHLATWGGKGKSYKLASRQARLSPTPTPKFPKSENFHLWKFIYCEALFSVSAQL